MLVVTRRAAFAARLGCPCGESRTIREDYFLPFFFAAFFPFFFAAFLAT
jgi:hypothetical protein